MSPLIDKPTTRARLEGMVLGMCLALLAIWLGYPLVTGQWHLL